jgi:hypothetical protein
MQNLVNTINENLDSNKNVAFVPHGQVGVVRDDPTVVKDKARTARGRGQ